MYDKESDARCIVRRSQLNEALGQVSILLTDKTGTLTQNKMVFKACSVNNTIFEEDALHINAGFDKLQMETKDGNEIAKYFLLTCAICHTVVPEENQESGVIVHHASSPGKNNFTSS